MTQISSRPLDKNREERMFQIFGKAIANLHRPEDIENFLHEFLSPVEKIMLAKRISIAVLLQKGFDYEAIKDLLHVTATTIAKVNLQRKYGGSGYKKVIEGILEEESVMHFWEKVEDVLSNIPHSKGASIVKQKKRINRF